MKEAAPRVAAQRTSWPRSRSRRTSSSNTLRRRCLARYMFKRSGFTIEADGVGRPDAARPLRAILPARPCCPSRHVLWTSVAGFAWRATPSAAPVRSCAPRRGAHRAHVPPARFGSPRRSPSWIRCPRPSTAGWPISSGIRTTRDARRPRLRDPHEQPEGLRLAAWPRTSWRARLASAASAATATTRRTRSDGICATRTAPRS